MRARVFDAVASVARIALGAWFVAQLAFGKRREVVP